VSHDIELRKADGLLNPFAIDVHRIPRLSSNKIPGTEKIDLYISFEKEFKDVYNADWLEGADGLTPPNHTYKVISNRQIFYVPIGKIHDHEDEYINPNTNITHNYKITVRHQPLLSNYWHFDLFVIDTSNQNELTYNRKWEKKIYSLIRERIQEIAVFKI